MPTDYFGAFCDRCGAVTNVTTGSMFNYDMICLECSRKEEAHPRYEEAKRADAAAVRAGDMNFPGIGLPPELAS